MAEFNGNKTLAEQEANKQYQIATNVELLMHELQEPWNQSKNPAEVS